MLYEVKNIYKKVNNKRVTAAVPGSKSLTARAMLIAALSDGESTLRGAQFSDDCKTFLNCLRDLGIECSANGTTVKITGCGGRLKTKSARINVGSAGTAARFLPAFLAFQDGEYFLDCSAQMKSRPITPLIETLENMGAEFVFPESENSYPFTIKGASEPKPYAEVDIAKSSQFLSALLISAVCTHGRMTVKSIGGHGLSYVDMTVRMMRDFGAQVEVSDGVYIVDGGYTAREYYIEPDVSAACYFYAMNRILGADITVDGVSGGSLQGDIKFIELLKDFNGGLIDMGGFSDQTLTLAAIAPYFDSPTEICGVEHIRRQECDRLRAISHNLAAMGVKYEERADGVKIYPSAPKPALIKTFGDHRVAMSFALTGLRADGIVIENAEVCSKTFKEYFEVLDKLCTELMR